MDRLHHDIWRILIRHQVRKEPDLSDCSKWPPFELNDTSLYDTTDQFDHQRIDWDYETLLGLSQSSRLLNDVVAEVLYNNIVLGDGPGDVNREHFLLLLRTLAKRPEFCHRIRHITIVPGLGGCSREDPGKAAIRLMGKGARKNDLEQAVTFLRVSDIRKLDMQAQTILNTAGLELAQGKCPSNCAIKKSTPWLERALAALVCFCPDIRSLRFREPVPAAGWTKRCVPFDIDGFERIIRKVREHATTQGNMFQYLEAVSILSSRQKIASKEAFSVYSSPRLTGFQALGFLSMKDWHRLSVFDCSSTLVHLDIGHLYPQRFHARWTNLDRPSTARARAASDLRKMLSSFTNLKFLRVSHALLTSHMGVEIKNFGDLMTEMLPPCLEHFEVAVFNHGINTWVEDPNIDISVMCFFKGLGLFNWDLQEEEYRGEFRASYPQLRKFGIMVHQKGNNYDGAEFWRDRRSINYKRLWEWLVYGENFLRRRHDYYQYIDYTGLPEDFQDEEELSDDGLPADKDLEVNGDDEDFFAGHGDEQEFPAADAVEDEYRQRGTLEALHGHMEELGVSFHVSTFQPQQVFGSEDYVFFPYESQVLQLIPMTENHPVNKIYNDEW
ncbi:hypothetical protein QBC32DRAFT_391511 [Pseudoneurospora amorphoporcata]|uniref:Uncharacterized protein n=1 Tax=Pseudoneurospora amorphoporcata TaxID=241081 RepID=A0AAN6NXQ4_9PEZI|nr:hypothetical protein QBC32DRAFT_391511 [Pseudoneurospora amorphoporcata]